MLTMGSALLILPPGPCLGPQVLGHLLCRTRQRPSLRAGLLPSPFLCWLRWSPDRRRWCPKSSPRRWFIRAHRPPQSTFSQISCRSLSSAVGGRRIGMRPRSDSVLISLPCLLFFTPSRSSSSSAPIRSAVTTPPTLIRSVSSTPIFQARSPLSSSSLTTAGLRLTSTRR
jgi:hypothetical protein